MLNHLRITQLGVIDTAEVEFGPGFTAVTGETGAGKTMVVSSLGLLLGGKADTKLIRHGEAKALVEGRLDADAPLTARVEAAGGDVDDGEVLLSRVITRSRARALLGGVQVPASVLGEAVGERLTLHGQSEQLRLGTPERQREVVDAYAGPELTRELAAYRADYDEHRALSVERAALVAAAQERARELAMLEFGLSEIEKADPQPGEDAALRAEAKRLQDADDLRAAARAALVALVGDDEADDPTALGLASGARKALEGIGSDPDAAALAARVAEASYLLSDVAGELASYLASLDADPARLEAIAERLAILQGLTRKYGESVDDVLAWGERAATRASELTGSDERIDDLGVRIDELDAALATRAETLTRLRRAAATELAQAAKAELSALAMPHARMIFDVREADRGPHGADRIELLFSANPGSEPAPLAKVASGGELSRVRLALEVVLASGSDGHTFVFDEVDAGVGGAVGLEIGRRLARLAQHAQVIVVTHLAQVAAFADRHYVVRKASDGQVTTSGVVEVTGDERVDELARMMAGLDGTDAARAHASELLAEAGAR